MTTPNLELPEPDYSGSTFDRYHLIRRLGVGGMGAVYEAEHTELRKHCAVKMLRQELAENEVFRRRFLREARAASAVAHPHVVDISDFGQTPDGQVYFVMELLQGRELQSLLDEQGRLPWPRTREILLQVTSALEAAHRLGVIHRDIKPANCFLVDLPGLGGEDFVKVLDFGIAKVSSKLDESTKQLTSTQEIFGTVAYMAPEMAMGKSDDPRSDIYSLGVMMYRMLVGELPFTEGNAFQILSQHVNDHPPRPRDKVPSIPEEVEAILLKAMAKKPAERFASMEEFALALRRGSVGADEPLELQATVMGMRPLGSDGSGPIRVERTTPLPPGGLVSDPTPRHGSGPIVMRASDSGTASIVDEPTMLATPIAGPRIEPTVALDGSPAAAKIDAPVEPTMSLDGSPVAAKAAAKVEPTVALDGAPVAAKAAAKVEPTVALDGSPVAAKAAAKVEPTVALGGAPVVAEERSTLEPAIAPRKRSALWVALPVIGLVGAAGLAMMLFAGPKQEAPVVGTSSAPAAPSQPAPAAVVPPETPAAAITPPEVAEPETPEVAEPEVPEVEDAPGTGSGDAQAQAEPATSPSEPSADVAADGNAPSPTAAAEPSPPEPAAEPEPAPEPAPAPVQEPKPAPKKTSKPKSTSKGGSSDAAIIKRLKAKILDECRFEMAGKRVTVSFIVTPSGSISMLTASPKNEGAQCAKEQVMGTKFQSRSNDTPIKIVVR